jgi:serine/threonine-protein kinase
MIGEVFRSRFELSLDLGETPLFHSFAAKDRLQGRDVCVRVLKSPFKEEPEFLLKLTQVVRQVSNVSHPGLERLHGADGETSEPFLVSELSKGTSLLERLKKLGALSVPVAVQTAIGVCEAVETLHMAGVVHGDLGSHNVAVGAEGELKVQLYAVWQAYASSSNAGSAMLPLMAPYLAPEIGKGGFPSTASDVYAIGVLLYEMLSGRYPFHAETPVAMAIKHATDATPNVRMMNPSVPVVLAEIVKKAMSKEPEDRYRDAGDMVSDLRILQDALRFGRTLNWPIREETKPAPSHPVAPKMSAIREPKRKEADEPAANEHYYEEEESADVPGWIKALIILFAGIMATLVVFWVVFNMNKPRMVDVPDLQRLSVTEAMSRLDGIGLKLRIARRQANDQVPQDQVIEASPPPGEKVYEGSTVSVTVSAGTKFVAVPDVRGMTPDEAKTMLGTLSLSLDSDIEIVADKNIKQGDIVGQIPEAGAKVQRESKIRVRVSGGKTVKVEEDASAKSKYQYTLRVHLIELENNVTVRIDLTDARGTKTVHEADHEPDELVEVIAEGYGKKATFRIFYDGELVSQKDVEATDGDVIE